MRRFISKHLHRQLRKFRYVKELVDFRQQYQENCSAHPGHFYSPIIDKQNVLAQAATIWPDELPAAIAAIDLNIDQQRQWAAIMESYYGDLRFEEQSQQGHRYYYQNEYYSYSDAISLYSFLRKLQPVRVVEVGSGFSSAVMLDTADQFSLNTTFHFIDPYPERLTQLLKQKDGSRVEILAKPLQEIQMELFESLQPNDILFIDSSHVLKTNSDVNFYLFEIFPRLCPGVFIHIHDIFYPFQYPKPWVEAGVNWSELFAVRAFLMNNSAYEIQFFSHYLHLMHPNIFLQMPLMQKNFGGNLWLKKVAS